MKKYLNRHAIKIKQTYIGQRFDLEQYVLYRGVMCRIAKVKSRRVDPILRSEAFKTNDEIFYTLEIYARYSLIGGGCFSDVPQSYIRPALPQKISYGLISGDKSFNELIAEAAA